MKFNVEVGVWGGEYVCVVSDYKFSIHPNETTMNIHTEEEIKKLAFLFLYSFS